MPPDMGTQPTQARERERSDKDREREKSSKQAEQAVASGSSSSSQRVGNYRLDAEIGRGSFATVYLGYKSVSRSSEYSDVADLFSSITYPYTFATYRMPEPPSLIRNQTHPSQSRLSLAKSSLRNY
jgi:hypothetical protein